MKSIGKIFRAVLWPILFGIGQFFVVAILSGCYLYKQIHTVQILEPTLPFEQILEKVDFTKLSDYLNQNLWIIILWNVIVILPIVIHVYRKQKRDVIQVSQKQYLYGILTAYSFSIVCNILFLNQSTNTSFSSYFFFLLMSEGILGPILEELIFRGIVYEKLQFLNQKNAFWISVLIFTFFHQNINQMVLAFFLGIYTTYLYQKTRNIKIPILFHIVVNMTALLVTPLFHTFSIPVLVILFFIHMILWILSSIHLN